MKATVVLKEASTYQRGGYNFKKGIPQQVTNPKDIKDLLTDGMVQVTVEDEKQKVSQGEVYTANQLKKMNLEELEKIAADLGIEEVPDTKKKIIAAIEEVQE